MRAKPDVFAQITEAEADRCLLRTTRSSWSSAMPPCVMSQVRRFIPQRLIAEYALPSAGVTHVELVRKQLYGYLTRRRSGPPLTALDLTGSWYSIDVSGVSGGGR